MTNKINLPEEFIEFASSTIKVLEKAKPTFMNKSIITQLIRSSTSAGANYHEACKAQSQKDFIHKLYLSYKELNETIYWFKIAKNISLIQIADATPLIKKSEQLIRIIASSIITAKKNNTNKT